MLNMNLFTIFTKKIIMGNDSFIIKFGGQDHQIEANTLVNTLIHYSTIINKINDIYGEGEAKVDIKINALKEGSFNIDIDVIGTLKDIGTFIFNKENANYAASVVTILTGVFGLYKVFKGKPAPINITINDNTINNITISQDTIINIYNNQIIRSAISNSIQTANEDEAVDSIELIKDKHPIVIIEKEEFETLIYDEFDKELINEDVKHETVSNATLSIVTVSFDKTKKWTFIYEGNKITIPMKDAVLLSLIDKGMRFAKGDAIRVDLEITKEYNDSYNAYENKKYRISKFIEHIPRPTQTTIF